MRARGESALGGGSARWSVASIFVIHGVLFASWTAHIPAVKAALGLSDASLGIALLGGPLGSVTASIAAGYLLPRIGSRRVIRIALAGYCASGVLVGVARSLPELFGALTVWGAFQGMLDVSMNTQAVTVESAAGRPLMSGLHGGWSLGSFLGAGLGAAAVALHVGLTPQLLVLGGLALVVGGWRSGALVPDLPHQADPAEASLSAHGAWRLLTQRVVLVLALVAFASMLCEGAAEDWSAVYLRDSLGSGAAVAGLGYAVFAAAMVVVRLGGDRMLGRWSAQRVLPALAGIGAVGFGVALAVSNPAVALVGLFCLGLGLGCVVPTAFSAAGALPGVHPGTAISTVAAIGWAGFVLGPPLIGHLADAVTLPGALVLLPAFAVLIMVLSRTSSAIRSRAVPQ